MTMPMVEGGRPILSVRVLGFPVTVDISFVVIVAILGWVPGRTTATSFVVWLLMVPLAVLVHELGHAFVARTTGAHPVITLAGLGGLTSYVPPAPLSRARSIAISVAGPAVGIVIGLALLAYARGVGVGDGLARDVVGTAIYTTLGWSVLNLLPILPLDGGQTLRELLPGSPAKRAVRAAVVSIVVAVLAAVAAVKAGLVFGALLAAFFVYSNVMTVRSARDLEKVDVNQRLVRLMWAGRTADAHDLLADQPADATTVHPLVRATVRAATDDPDAGRGELETAVRLHPGDPTAASLLLLLHRTRDDWPAVRDLLAGGAAPDPGSVLAAQTVAFRSGAKRASAEIGQAWLDRLGPEATAGDELPGLIGYNTACGWVGAGDLDRGLAAFRRAAELGFADLTTVDSDDDIAPLRPLPGYDEARQLVRRRALAASEPGESPAR
jgi:Zn-dependent protease